MTTPSDVAEQVKIALYHIQQAQLEIERACQALSPIKGAARHWTGLSQLFGMVQERWHRLNNANTSLWTVER